MIFWTRARTALTAAAALGGLAMLYEGLFEIRKLSHLACPLAQGCESVATAPFSYPLGLAFGLLAAAWMGLVCAAAQGRSRGAAVTLVVLADLAVIAAVLRLSQMFQLGAQCSWCWLWAACALVAAVLSIRCLREQVAGASAPEAQSPPGAGAAPKP